MFKADFDRRLLCIDKEIVGARNHYITQGVIDKGKEPFSIRKKEFWDVSEASKLLSDKFRQNLAHEPDGLIFQPACDPYRAGTDQCVLKWKPLSMNSVDFRLKVVREGGLGIVPKTMGHLFVGGHDPPFASMKVRLTDRLDCVYKIANLGFSSRGVYCVLDSVEETISLSRPRWKKFSRASLKNQQ